MVTTIRIAREGWTHSTREEVIAVLWLIAGLAADSQGKHWLALICYAKFVLDTIAALYYAVRHGKESRVPRS